MIMTAREMKTRMSEQNTAAADSQQCMVALQTAPKQAGCVKWVTDLMAITFFMLRCRQPC
jgi:hypothetical protein